MIIAWNTLIHTSKTVSCTKSSWTCLKGESLHWARTQILMLLKLISSLYHRKLTKAASLGSRSIAPCKEYHQYPPETRLWTFKKTMVWALVRLKCHQKMALSHNLILSSSLRLISVSSVLGTSERPAQTLPKWLKEMIKVIITCSYMTAQLTQNQLYLVLKSMTIII